MSELTRPIKIAFVTTQSDAMGGSHVHVRDVAGALMRDGHEAKVFLGGNGPYFDVLEKNGIPFHRLTHMVRPLDPMTDLKGIKELRQALREFKPDLVSSHSSKAGILARIAGKKEGIPTLFTAHGWSFTDGVPGMKRRIFEAAERYVGKFSKRIVCVAEADRQLAIDRRVCSADRLITIHNGMPESPERADPGAEPPMIVSIARLDEQKDHPTLLRALAALKDLPWSLELVGGGPREEELKQLAEELGIANRVAFHGTQSNVKPFLERAQLFVLISNYEGFPRSTVEAMRTGLPAIVSDVGGSREALEEGVSGFSVPAHDVQVLQDRLRAILGDPELRRSMGEVARQRYEREFTFERMYEKTKTVYAELVE